MINSDFRALEYIESCTSKANEDIDVGLLAMAMVYDDHEGLLIDRYKNHVNKVADQVNSYYQGLIGEGAEDDVGVRLAALKHVIYDSHHYQADTKDHEILESADFIRVIDRGKGCATALCLLYMDSACKAGWQIEGLNVPSGYLCRLEYDGQRIVFDPAQGCRVMQAHDLRHALKQSLGEAAELSTEYLKGKNVRQVVVHLCNHIKLRRIEMGEYEKALQIITRMRLLVPDEYRLLLDSGVLFARTGNNQEAIYCLNAYIGKAQNFYDKHEAKMLLQELDSS